MDLFLIMAPPQKLALAPGATTPDNTVAKFHRDLVFNL